MTINGRSHQQGRFFRVPNGIVERGIHFLRVHLLYADVGLLFDRLRQVHRDGRKLSDKDLEGFEQADGLLALPSAAEPYETALPRLRSSVNAAIVRYEKRLLFKMGTIHFVDVLMSLAGAICSMGILRLFEGDLPAVMAQHQVALAVGLAVLVFAFNVGSTALHCRKIDWEMLLSFRIRMLISRYLLAHSLEVPRDRRGRYVTGELVSLSTQDAKHIAHFYAHGFVDLFVLGASAAILLGLMVLFFGAAAVFGFVVFLLHIPLILFFSRTSRLKNTKLMQRTSERLALLNEWLLGMRLVRYFGWGPAFVRSLSQRSRAEYAELRDVHLQYSVAFAISTSWWMLVAVSILGSMLWMEGAPSVSATFGVLWLSARLGALINPLPWFVAEGSMARVSDGRIRAFLQLPTQKEIVDSLAHKSVSDTERGSDDVPIGSIRSIGFCLRDLVVRFGDAEQDVLNIPSLDIGPGRSLAVVGSVGSGKSVLQNVLLGEIAPHRGSVELVIHWDANGAKRTTRLDVYSERGLQFLRKVASYAPQQSVVLSLTVRENVPLALDSRGTGESDLDDARIIAALGRVQLEQDLRAFPAGLDTLIGERGINLSGGQKQRLSLGRAEYFGRPLVVLDDPLSAVDRDTESALNALFFATDDQGHSEGADKRTLIVSTHRLSCVALCDDVLLLENGRVASFGPTQDLLKDDSSVTLWLRSHHES